MIRAADAGDADAVASLLSQLGYPVDARAVPARLAHLREDGRSEAYVAVHEGVVAGVIAVHAKASLTRDEDLLMITALVVDDRHRGHGVGRELVDAAEGWGRGQKCGRMVVTTANHRDGAHAFYNQLGWEWTGRRYIKTLAP